jgi:hypothetical protein
MFEFVTALLATKDALSVAERQANSLSFLSVAPVEPSLKQNGTGSDAAGSFGGLASKLFISSPVYALREKALYDNSNPGTVFSAPVNSADTVQVQGKNSNGLYVNILTIWILGNSGGCSFRAGRTFNGVARP